MLIRRMAALLVALLLLGACSGTSQPSPQAPVVASATASLAEGTPAGTAQGPPPLAPASPTPALPPAGPTARPSPRPTGAAADDEPLPGSLRELDFRVPAGNSYGPRSLAVDPGGGRVYARTYLAAQPNTGSVTMLDARSGEVLAVVETGADSYAEGQLLLDPDRALLYAVNPGDETCSVLDTGSLEPTALLPGVQRLVLDGHQGRLYLAGSGGLRLVDAGSRAPRHQVAVGVSPRFLLAGVDPAGDRLYLAYDDGGRTLLGIYQAASLVEVATLPLPGRPDDLAVDAGRGRLYLSLDDGRQSLLWTVDRGGQTLEQRVLGEWTDNNSLALDAANGRLLLGREGYNRNAIVVLDPESGRETEIALDAAPNSLAWDEAGGRLLVSHTYSNELGVVDLAGGQEVETWPTAINVTDLATDPARGLLFVTDTAGRLHVLEAGGTAALDVLPGAGRIAVDSTHGRLYTGGPEAGVVRIFDLPPAGSLLPAVERGQIAMGALPVADEYHGSLLLVRSGIYLASLETLTVTRAIPDTLPQEPGYSPNPAAVDAAVDPGSGRIYALVNNGVPGSNNGNYLYVYEPETYRRILTDTERSVAYLSVDAGSGRVYVSRAHLAGRSTALLAGGRQYEARLDAVFGALEVDPGRGRLYAAVTGDQEGQLLVLDAANLDVLGSVPIPGGFSLRAADPERRLLYLVSHDGRVQVWSTTDGRLPAPEALSNASLPRDEAAQFFPGPGDNPLFAGSLYRSDDGGQSWAFVGHGLPPWEIAQVAVSPKFEQDGTLFAVPRATDAGLGVWKSTDAGRSWRMANRGLSDLAVHALAISPAFGQDQTLLALTRRQGLFRSVDGGERWDRLTERYQGHMPGFETASLVAFSPTYGQDHTLLLVHGGLKCSTDGGETWSSLATGSLAPSSLALSPAFARDRTLFGWFGQAGLLSSTDGGEVWQPAVEGLYLRGYGSARLTIAPDYPTSRILYLQWLPSSPDGAGQIYRSLNGGEDWQQVAGAIPAAASEVRLSADGSAFLALDGDGHLVRWPVEEMAWQASRLPDLAEIEFHRLVPSPGFQQDRTLFAFGQGVGVLRSRDAGLTWADTGFPLRVILGELPALTVLGPDQALAGTLLGLYRYDGVNWRPVGGDLPRQSALGPTLGPDGSWRVVLQAGSQIQQQGPWVWLSTDGGLSWREALPPVPRPAAADELVLSPALASDGTAFLATAWEEPLRSLGGGPWEPMPLPHGGHLVSLDVSPTFERDQLLFLGSEDNRLWRSRDGGETWSLVDGPWGDEAPRAVAPTGSYRLAAVTFSPAYAQDGALLLGAGGALYRSTDAGGSWRKVLEPGLLTFHASFSPVYARDGTILIQQGNGVYRSVDRGATWQALPAAPWQPADETGLQLSPTFGRDRTVLAWGLSGLIFGSQDGGQSWQDLRHGLPTEGGGIRQVIFSPVHAQDGLLFLVPYGGGLYKSAGLGPWVLASEPAPVPLPGSTPVPSPTPAPTARATPCPLGAVQFRAVWEQAAGRLGCAAAPAEQRMLAQQPFEQGSMIWDSGTRRILVLLASGTWRALDDTWVEGQDPAYDPALPPPPRQPQRGFGKVWREHLGGPQAAIGWAVENERALDGWVQRFERGLLVWTDAVPAGSTSVGTAHLLYDDGTWQAVPAPQP
jgi:photosystem II stability/assembly factor-like uncharacterized protein/DNA-binding beta-propeller fold protein YncE